MNYVATLLLVLATLVLVKSNPVLEVDEDELDVAARALPTAVIHLSTLPIDAELLLLNTIQDVHGRYYSNRKRAEAVSGAFNHRSYYCGWNVIIFKAPAVVPPADFETLGAVRAGTIRSAFALILVTEAAPSTSVWYYYVFSSPQQSRRCEFV